MSPIKAGGKWIEGLSPEIPVADAAALVLEPRLESVIDLLHLRDRKASSASDTTSFQIRRIHQLRVATRRCAATIRFFRPTIKKKHATRSRAILREVRKAAGDARSLDVDRQLLLGLAAGTADPLGIEPLNDAERSAISDAALWLEAERQNAELKLANVQAEFFDDELRYRFGRLLMGIHPPRVEKVRRSKASQVPRPITTLRDLAACTLPSIVEPLRAAVHADTLTMEELHQLRIACKQARYATEICWPLFVDDDQLKKAEAKNRPAWSPFERGPYAGLVAMQDRLGVINDGHELGIRLSVIASELSEHSPSTRDALLGLIERIKHHLETERDAFLSWWWGDPSSHRFVEQIVAAVDASTVSRHDKRSNAQPPLDPHKDPPAKRERARMPKRQSSSEQVDASNHSVAASISIPTPDTLIHEPLPIDTLTESTDRPAFGQTKRIAAIDVGTNSLRLVVAEARADGWFRVVDDEKAVTRLGKGLAQTGRMQPETIALSAQAIARMRVIADGYGVERIRVIATAAARDASNGEELVAAVRDTSGLEMEIISSSEEARLAVRSVDHAFHLENMHAAVVDVGGGSTEVVLTANGLIDQVFPLKLGAVRLTEQFGTCEPGSPTSETVGYDALRTFVRNTLRDEVGKLDFVPQMLFGTGGIFTSLASISMHGSIDGADESAKPAAEGPNGVMLPFKLRGFELRRSEVKHILDRVRKLSVKDRARVPGISPDRAEIAVAGLAIVEAVMKHLGINLVRVHDRGIREGLLLEMIDDIFGRPAGSIASPEKLDRFSAAKRFALACHYEAPHAHHVADLATSIFDQLIVALNAQDEPWASPICRELVASASLLHDVGYLINYAKHHKHSYHLIRHSDMPGFTPRELEIVANIARYHRRSEPKKKHPNFARLNEADRAIASRLSAITRLADGLARSHTRNVRRVELSIEDGAALFTLVAARDPSVDLWGGQRKVTLFEHEFNLKARFDWKQDDQPDEPSSSASAAADSSEHPAPPAPDMLDFEQRARAAAKPAATHSSPQEPTSP